ncbi:MAG TPA: bacillithiol biosynthesis cysteine-adding enzyme BshC [Chitinophagaceae bacterium]|nr:bacillithiol biosynthesis cysteine-adding enzyme BshC [Chitinophagaceae bacterium]
MPFRSTQVPYSLTGHFTPLVLDYLSGKADLKPFYRYDPQNLDFQKIIDNRKLFPVDRELLAGELEKQYQGLPDSRAVLDRIGWLRKDNSFTVCTAHQPNLFTGYLYFVYKLIQTIKVADQLQARYPAYQFVPVYYMGSEDADLEELNRIQLDGKTIIWNTDQKGAVGRMAPEGLETQLEQIREAVSGQPFSDQLQEILESAYRSHPTLQQGTLALVHALFGKSGLVVLIPDRPGFKKKITPVLRAELFQSVSAPLVAETASRLSTRYKVQANPREINLFYLGYESRERIVRSGEKWEVLNTGISWDKSQLELELEHHPERFSPNVILRGVLQESILPNLAFIGGGGELSYWLELRGLFENLGVSYPALILRNSVLWVDHAAHQKMEKLGISPTALFAGPEQVVADYVKVHAQADLSLAGSKAALEQIFAGLEDQAGALDPTLVESVKAHLTKARHLLDRIAEKFLRAQKKKMGIQVAQIRGLKEKLFPGHSLQERKENFIPFYCHYGPLFFDTLYRELDPLGHQFTIITETA